MSIFKKIVFAFTAVLMMAGVVRAGEIKFGVTDITGLESLQTEYGDFVKALEEVTGDKIKFFPVNSRTAAVEALANAHVDYILTGPAQNTLCSAHEQKRCLSSPGRGWIILPKS